MWIWVEANGKRHTARIAKSWLNDNIIDLNATHSHAIQHFQHSPNRNRQTQSGECGALGFFLILIFVLVFLCEDNKKKRKKKINFKIEKRVLMNGNDARQLVKQRQIQVNHTVERFIHATPHAHSILFPSTNPSCGGPWQRAPNSTLSETRTAFARHSDAPGQTCRLDPQYSAPVKQK